jgi:uncharacterized protein (TIGR02001 family)
MKQSFLAAAIAAALGAPITPALAEESPHTFTANVGLFSNYLFRSISQTAGEPAIQGGFDYGHSSGFYAGTWASNISWLEDYGMYTRSSLNGSVYAGIKRPFANSDFYWNTGAVYYFYPGDRNPGVSNANTTEVYGALGWKWVGVKASYSLTNYFAARPTGEDTNGTWYLDLYANYPIADTGFVVGAHVGHLDVKNDGNNDINPATGGFANAGKLSYTDWRIGASYYVPAGFANGLFKNVELGAYYSGNNAENRYFTDLTGHDNSKNAFLVYVKRTF